MLGNDRVKVKSHIDKEEAPKEMYWQVNYEADELATFARNQVYEGILTAHPPQVLPGSAAVVSIDGQLCLTDLKQKIYTRIYQLELEEFLMRKYDWGREEFASIDWRAQETYLQRLHLIPRITAFKFVHG